MSGIVDSFKQRPVLLKLLVVGIIVLSMVIGYFTSFRPGIYLEGVFYHKVSDGLYRNGRENTITITDGSDAIFHWKDRDISLNIKGDSFERYELTFSDGTALNARWDGAYLENDDGIPLIYEGSYVGITADDTKSGRYVTRESMAQTALAILEGKTETVGEPFYCFFGIVVFLFGVLQLLYPDAIDHFRHGIWHSKIELSDEGRVMIRFAGVFLIGLGILMMTGLLNYILT